MWCPKCRNEYINGVTTCVDCGCDLVEELPEEIDTRLQDLTLTPDMLAGGNRLADMNIPKGTLVMLIKRGNEFLIPNGQMELHPGDKLLVMLENKKPAET